MRQDPVERFLQKLQELQQGPLHELEALLKESKGLHEQALRAAQPQKEQEALRKVEVCSSQASAVAKKTVQGLDALRKEDVEGTAGLSQQAFNGVSAAFKKTLEAFFQAQQNFRASMDEKVTRQLRAAFPEADEAQLRDIAAGQRTAAGAITSTMAASTGRTGTLDGGRALQVKREQLDELEVLARTAKELQQAFLDIDNLVSAQGEVIDDIAAHVHQTKDQTEATGHQLDTAIRSNARCRKMGCVITVATVMVLVVAFFVVKQLVF